MERGGVVGRGPTHCLVCHILRANEDVLFQGSPGCINVQRRGCEEDIWEGGEGDAEGCAFHPRFQHASPALAGHVSMALMASVTVVMVALVDAIFQFPPMKARRVPAASAAMVDAGVIRRCRGGVDLHR